METRARVKDEDGEDAYSPFSGLQKNAVLHSAKAFNDSPLDPRKCCNVLTEILYLLSQGEKLTAEEATEVFFGVTKLFQSQDAQLRRLVYLVIKELNQNQDEAFIIISSLEKDINGRVDNFRANAIRVLSKVMEPSMLEQRERFLRQAIVNRDAFVASSAIVAGTHLFRTCPDVIKRWVNEVQEACRSPNPMVQFQALGLLHKIKRHDRRAIVKVVSALARNPPESPFAHCLLIRYTFSVLGNDPPAALVDFLRAALSNYSDVVSYEAAKAICNIPNVSSKDVRAAVAVLQEFLNSPVPLQRFSAVRTLSNIVSRFPVEVTNCSADLEHLMTDPNRNVATLAITTLLKTGVEASVDRLMKSITEFMNDIADELKIVLVDAIQTLCLKFPQKYETLLNFLSTVLREEGGFEYKRSIVGSIATLMDQIADSRESGLDHLCEFIEDCEFPELSIQILHMLGEMGPETSNPARYIRFIFNRVILELPSVRAAAVAALGKLATVVPNLRENVLVLLKRSVNDNDDEVRDRATYYISLLGQGEEGAATAKSCLEVFPREGEKKSAAPNLRDLEHSLLLYLENPLDEAFNLSHVVKAKVESKAESKSASVQASAYDSPTKKRGGKNIYQEELAKIPEFAEFGDIFRSSQPVDLTEQESEYQVELVKHIYEDRIIFQFNVQNTLEDQLLTNVSVEIEFDGETLEEEMVVEIAQLPCGEEIGRCYVVAQRAEGEFTIDPMEAKLKFIVKDAEAENPEFEEGYDDEYELNNVEVLESGFIKEAYDINHLQFKKQWKGFGSDGHLKKYSLAISTLQEAVDAVTKLVGLTPVENCNVVEDGAESHVINMAGRFIGGILILARALFLLDKSGGGVTLKIAARSEEQPLCELVTGSIR